MVDFLRDPKFWTDGIRAMTGALQFIVPLLLAVIIGTWWFARGQSKDRYQGTIDGLREKIEVLEQRVHLAKESEQTVARKSTELETQVETLRAQIAAGASSERLMGATGVISVTASEIKVANTEIGKALMTIPLGPTGYFPGGNSESLGRKTRP